MPNILQYLPFENYKKRFDSAKDGCMGLDTHLAEVVWDDGVARDSYVKFYNHKVHKRALLNEGIGHLIVNSLGLPQPECAGYLQFSISEETTPALWENASEVERYSGFTYGWVSTNIIGGVNRRLELDSLHKVDRIAYETVLGHLITALKKWPELAELIMCDDWLINADRNLGNLLELPNKTFALIDHGNILYGNSWNAWEIMRAETVTSKFQALYCKILDQKYADDLLGNNLLIEDLSIAKVKHQSALESIKLELVELIRLFIGSEIVETNLPGTLHKQKVSDILEDYFSSSASPNIDIQSRINTWLAPTSNVL